jgi:integrase
VAGNTPTHNHSRLEQPQNIDTARWLLPGRTVGHPDAPPVQPRDPVPAARKTATETKGPRFATLAVAAGADVYWVSRQLGHTDIGTTLKHYARFLPDVQERNLGLLNAYFQAGRVSELGHGG